MNIPTDPQLAGAAPPGPGPTPTPLPAEAPQQVHADDHWPICRCTHPTDVPEIDR